MIEGPKYVSREHYLEELEAYRATPDIKVLQGVRRCGKSTLLAMFRKKLADQGLPSTNVFYRRFDALEIPLDYTAEDLRQELASAFALSDPGHPFYVFLDEIQEVDSWERVVRRLHTQEGIDVYLTGSNASMLSTDLATQLAGRTIAIDIFPLSFREFLLFNRCYFPNDQRPKEELFAQYLRFGGMPGLFNLKDRSQEHLSRELTSIFNTVLLNDVARRGNVRDIALLERLSTYVLSTSGNLFSTRKISGALTSMGRKTSGETVDNYLRLLEEALLLFGPAQIGIAGKEVLSPLRKFYCVDSGLANLTRGFRVQDTGFQLEGVIYVELRRRGFSVSVGSLDASEVDFVAERNDERIYVQVSESLADPQTFERELAPLRSIHDAFPKLVLALDHTHAGTTEDGIKVKSIIPWLCDE